MANLRLHVDSNFYLTVKLEESIQEGENIIVVWDIDSELEYYRSALAYQNNKRKGKEYVTGDNSLTIGSPFNQKGFLGLEFIFDTRTQGQRKTNTIWANVQYSIAGNPDDLLAELLSLAFTSTIFEADTNYLVFYNIKGEEVARVEIMSDSEAADIMERLEAVETQLLEVSQTVSANSAKLIEQGNMLVNNTDAISANAQNITNNRLAIESNTETINDHETRIEANKTEIENHESRIVQNATNIETNTNNITANKVEIDQNKQTLTSHDGRIKTNTDNISAHSMMIADNTSNIQTNTTNITTAQADIVSLREDLTSNVSTLQGLIDNIVSTTYTKTEVDNLISGLEFDTSWQEPVATYADLATTYPNPENGWTVLVLDEGHVYNYNGTEWVQITSGATVEYANETTDGIITSANFIEWQAKVSLQQLQAVQTNVTNNTNRIQTTETDIDNIETKINEQSLTNQDLNVMYGANYWSRKYYAVGGNTISNKPEGVDTFHLAVMRSSDIYTTQLLCSSNTAKGWFVRTWNGTTWSDWTNDEMIISEKIDEITATIEANTTRITNLETKTTDQQLTNENLNDMQGSDYWDRTYYADGSASVLNKPTSVGSMYLTIKRSGIGATTQILYASSPILGIYTRTYAETWSEWSNDVNNLRTELQTQIDTKKENLYGYGYAANVAQPRYYKLAEITAVQTETVNYQMMFSISRMNTPNRTAVRNYIGIGELDVRFVSSTGYNIAQSEFKLISVTDSLLDVSTVIFVNFVDNKFSIYARTVEAYDGWRIDLLKDLNLRTGASVNNRIQMFTYTNGNADGATADEPEGTKLYPQNLTNEMRTQINSLNTQVASLESKTGYASNTTDGIVRSTDYTRWNSTIGSSNNIIYMKPSSVDGLLPIYSNPPQPPYDGSGTSELYMDGTDVTFYTSDSVFKWGDVPVTTLAAEYSVGKFVYINPTAYNASAAVNEWFRLTDDYMTETGWYVLGTTTENSYNNYPDVILNGYEQRIPWADENTNGIMTTQLVSEIGGRIGYLYASNTTNANLPFDCNTQGVLRWRQSNYNRLLSNTGKTFVLPLVTNTTGISINYSSRSYLIFNPVAMQNGESYINYLIFSTTIPDDNNWYVIGHTFSRPSVSATAETRPNVFLFSYGWIRDVNFNINNEATTGKVLFQDTNSIIADSSGNVTPLIGGYIRVLIDQITTIVSGYFISSSGVLTYENNNLLILSLSNTTFSLRLRPQINNTNIASGTIAIGYMKDKNVNGETVPGVYIYGVGWIDPNTEEAALRTKVNELEARLEALENA